jgi:CRP-like cAMP-binding protein
VPRTYTLKSNIIRAGDIGKEMYILEKGEVEVYLENDTQPSFRLGEGSFFGEIALLSDTSALAKRSSTVKVS